MDTINWQDVSVGLGFSLLIGVLVAQIAARTIRIVLLAVSGNDKDTSFRDPIQRRPIQIMRAIIFFITLILVGPPVLEALGVQLSYGIPLDEATAWLFEGSLRVALIAILAYFSIRMASLSVSHFEKVVTERRRYSTEKDEFSQRLHTIGGLIKNAVNVLVVSAAALMILQEVGVNIAPLLTAAGIGGLAIGFGAQNLVRDVISGFFLILEDQIHVGDVVSVDNTSGLVESVKLRTIVLRDLSGTVHVIPNGSITTLSNMTKEFSFYVMDVGVAYKEDTDHVAHVLEEVGNDLQSDDSFGPHILAPLEILGVNDFADSAVNIKIRIKTLPLKQWMIGRELRRRIKKAFDAEGIEIPFPHTSIYFGEASGPLLTKEFNEEELKRLASLKAEKPRARKSQTHISTAGDVGESGDGV